MFGPGTKKNTPDADEQQTVDDEPLHMAIGFALQLRAGDAQSPRRPACRRDSAASARVSLRSRHSSRCSAIFSAIQQSARSFIRSVHVRGPSCTRFSPLSRSSSTRASASLKLAYICGEAPFGRHVADHVVVRVAVLAIQLVPVWSDRDDIHVHQGLAGAALWPVRRRCGVRGGGFADNAGFPACSHALVIIDATAVMASFRRFSRIGRVSAKSVSKYWSS